MLREAVLGGNNSFPADLYANSPKGPQDGAEGRGRVGMKESWGEATTVHNALDALEQRTPVVGQRAHNVGARGEHHHCAQRGARMAVLVWPALSMVHLFSATGLRSGGVFRKRKNFILANIPEYSGKILLEMLKTTEKNFGFGTRKSLCGEAEIITDIPEYSGMFRTGLSPPPC